MIRTGGGYSFGIFESEKSMEKGLTIEKINRMINGTERNGTERNGTERNGTERNGTERNGTERNGR